MENFPSHWLFPKDSHEARQAQQEMARKVLLEDTLPTSLVSVGGVDISNTPFDPEKRVFGAAVVLSLPSLAVIEEAIHTDIQHFPYIPGLLGFREVPCLLKAYKNLFYSPNVLLVDGHGVSHPRGLGVASHLGILLDIPTIGVAKSLLVGKPSIELSDPVGSTAPILFQGKTVGATLRTRKGALPLIISAGHRITLERAIEVVIGCLKGYRLPEPTRHAHLAANRYRKLGIIKNYTH